MNNRVQRKIVNDSQATQNSYDYEAFGSFYGTPTENVTNSYTYTGREWDSESGTYYYRARQYDPNSGRFGSRDSIGHINLYNYVKNKPVIYSDPTGNAELDPLKEKQLNQGTVKWRVTTKRINEWGSPSTREFGCDFYFEFHPKQGCCCKTIDFIQVVTHHLLGGTQSWDQEYTSKEMKARAKYFKQFIFKGGTGFVDHKKGETNPFIGVKYDTEKEKWVSGYKKGDDKLNHSGTCDPDNNGANMKHAAMTDAPLAPVARDDKGMVIWKFQSCAVCVETHKIYGCVQWGFYITDKKDSKVEILMGKKEHVTEKPSQLFWNAVTQWNKVASKKEGWHQFNVPENNTDKTDKPENNTDKTDK